LEVNVAAAAQGASENRMPKSSLSPADSFMPARVAPEQKPLGEEIVPEAIKSIIGFHSGYYITVDVTGAIKIRVQVIQDIR
jgi:hypothetical protein